MASTGNVVKPIRPVGVSPGSRPAAGARPNSQRQADQLARARRKQLRRHQLKATVGSIVRRRARALRDYARWRARLDEAAAAQQAAVTCQVSPAIIRRWHRLYRADGLAAFVPHTPGPRHADRCVSGAVPFLVVALRRLFGWNEKRLAHELAQRGIAQLSHTTVARIFARYYLPTRT